MADEGRGPKQLQQQQQQQQQVLSAEEENRVSRILATPGLDRAAIERLQRQTVLIQGLNGLGVEIAKNIVLFGLKGCVLHDDKAVTPLELSSQFFLGEEDIGTNRAEACVAKVAELNPSVAVSASTEPITDAFLRSFGVVICCDATLAQCEWYDRVCRAHGVKFVWVNCMGVMGQLFCDFGDSFEVTDTDGEVIKTGIVCGVSAEREAAVAFVPEGKDGAGRLELEAGLTVQLGEINGMAQLNGKVCVLKQKIEGGVLVGGVHFAVGETVILMTTPFYPY